jgi:hypothetical protein
MRSLTKRLSKLYNLADLQLGARLAFKPKCTKYSAGVHFYIQCLFLVLPISSATLEARNRSVSSRDMMRVDKKSRSETC